MDSSAPETETRAAVREVVAPLWCEALAVPEVSDDDDFFALGGHSLAALHVISTVEQTYGVELAGPRDIWENPTLGAFVSAVAAAVAGRVPAPPADGRAAAAATGTGE
ncbi:MULTISPECIES: acyl carrier protein [Streptomyces]|uniref:acyl carrier protein n=1 Tax=Streptomyces TaxID=1883 RepID=UPI001D13AE22|nr:MULTISPECIES: acyl carrier protein [Streptomyces]MCC3650358.1 acyl carrier protein [Streptomyces sp. S07_1.15]WSQ74651.1 acyl carrier protein [Streptomyces xinghaiensis]